VAKATATWNAWRIRRPTVGVSGACAGARSAARRAGTGVAAAAERSRTEDEEGNMCSYGTDGSGWVASWASNPAKSPVNAGFGVQQELQAALRPSSRARPRRRSWCGSW
jgi:hypothetical protein